MGNEFFSLIDNLKSNNTEVAKVACRDAALLLERHVQKKYSDASYKDLLSESSLFDLRLNEEDFDEIVDCLVSILENNEDCADIAAWGIGKLNDYRLRKNLLDALKHYLLRENDEVVYQIIVSLENYGLDKDMSLIEEVVNSTKLVKSSEYTKEVINLSRRNP